MGVHSSWAAELAPWEKAAAAATAVEMLALFGWRPADASARQIRNSVWTDDRATDYLQHIEQRLARIERARSDLSSAAYCREFRSAIAISRADPSSSLAKARQILEGIASDIYRQHTFTEPIAKKRPPRLIDMIEELLADKSLFPRKIGSYLHTIRVLGNMAVHPDPRGAGRQSQIGETDVEVNLLMLLQLIEWYLLEYPGGQTAPWTDRPRAGGSDGKKGQ